MCWQDGCGVERPKTAEQQQTWLPHPCLNKTIPLTGKMAVACENNSNLINLHRLWLSKCFHLFNFPLSGPSLLQPKQKCVFHPHCLAFTVCSTPFLLTGPQRIQRSFTVLHVTMCRWDSHVTLLLTVVRLGKLATQDAGVQQFLPVRWWADVSVGLIISWETDLLASYILQVVVSYRP